MGYAKPMITIELDEYNELKKFEQTVLENKKEAVADLTPYKLALEGIVERIGMKGDIRLTEYILDSIRSKDVKMTATQTNGKFCEVHCEMMKFGRND